MPAVCQVLGWLLHALGLCTLKVQWSLIGLPSRPPCFGGILSQGVEPQMEGVQLGSNTVNATPGCLSQSHKLKGEMRPTLLISKVNTCFHRNRSGKMMGLKHLHKKQDTANPYPSGYPNYCSLRSGLWFTRASSAACGPWHWGGVRNWVLNE